MILPKIAVPFGFSQILYFPSKSVQLHPKANGWYFPSKCPFRKKLHKAIIELTLVYNFVIYKCAYLCPTHLQQ